MVYKRSISYNSGISKITLIGIAVAIIVLIIIINSSSKTKNYKNFKLEMKEYTSAISQDYSYRKSNYSYQITDAQIYYGIAMGETVNESTTPVPAGNFGTLGLDVKPSKLKGSNFYEIKDDSNISNISSQRVFYRSDEKHYITDDGDFFILPGFKIEEDGIKKWYITESNYYESDVPVMDIEGITFGEVKITTDQNGENEAGNNVKKDTKLYIYFDAKIGNEDVTVLPALPYEVTENGTYSFTVSMNGRTFSKDVVVDNYRTKLLSSVLKIGDYVDYVPDSIIYRTSKSDTGYSTQNLATETKSWRIIHIDDVEGSVMLTPSGVVNNGLYLSGLIGAVKGADTIDTICKELYSNKKLGITARSMTIEDANRIFEHVPSNNQTRYAYYPRGTQSTGTIEFEGNQYTKTTNEWRTSRFYMSDGGGVEATDSNGLTYREAEIDNPVYVTQTYYNYKNNNVVGNVLGKSKAWLSSTCTYLKETGAGFEIRTVSSTGVDAEVLYDSFSNVTTTSLGLHPVIEIKDNYTINIDDKTRDGSTTAKAWKIMKDE